MVGGSYSSNLTSGNLTSERLLYKNSCNLSALIHLLTIHEDNTNRFIRQQTNNETNIVNLLNNVFTNNNTIDIDISGSYINRNTRVNNLILNDGTLNSTYLTEMKYSDLSYCIYTTCPITREPFEADTPIVIINACGHYFKKNAIIPWMRQSECCPYCRKNIIGNVNVNINDSEIYS